eukprot:TRINITY_DN1212_c0_g2_i1.p3 TRINITY_DN1212_c0_g2~~TRINITY_DN1212_c0_g2_i1.p3  ORF type:complete len:107 (-),score=7.26 TRINITY_DN1212_c0_g2_i1:424-744(-)
MSLGNTSLCGCGFATSRFFPTVGSGFGSSVAVPSNCSIGTASLQGGNPACFGGLRKAMYVGHPYAITPPGKQPEPTARFPRLAAQNQVGRGRFADVRHPIVRDHGK